MFSFFKMRGVGFVDAVTEREQRRADDDAVVIHCHDAPFVFGVPQIRPRGRRSFHGFAIVDDGLRAHLIRHNVFGRIAVCGGQTGIEIRQVGESCLIQFCQQTFADQHSDHVIARMDDIVRIHFCTKRHFCIKLFIGREVIHIHVHAVYQPETIKDVGRDVFRPREDIDLFAFEFDARIWFRANKSGGCDEFLG